VFGRADVVLQQGVVRAIPLPLDHPFRFLFHVFVLGVQQFLEVLLFQTVEVTVDVLLAVLDGLHPILTLFLGLVDVVDSPVVVAVDLVLQVASEAAFRVLVFPQVAELLQVYHLINKRFCDASN
jgi:hypothetical protein